MYLVTQISIYFSVSHSFLWLLWNKKDDRYHIWMHTHRKRNQCAVVFDIWSGSFCSSLRIILKSSVNVYRHRENIKKNVPIKKTIRVPIGISPLIWCIIISIILLHRYTYLHTIFLVEYISFRNQNFPTGRSVPKMAWRTVSFPGKLTHGKRLLALLNLHQHVFGLIALRVGHVDARLLHRGVSAAAEIIVQ